MSKMLNNPINHFNFKQQNECYCQKDVVFDKIISYYTFLNIHFFIEM